FNLSGPFVALRGLCQVSKSGPNSVTARSNNGCKKAILPSAGVGPRDVARGGAMVPRRALPWCLLSSFFLLHCPLPDDPRLLTHAGLDGMQAVETPDEPTDVSSLADTRPVETGGADRSETMIALDAEGVPDRSATGSQIPDASVDGADATDGPRAPDAG